MTRSQELVLSLLRACLGTQDFSAICIDPAYGFSYKSFGKKKSSRAIKSSVLLLQRRFLRMGCLCFWTSMTVWVQKRPFFTGEIAQRYPEIVRMIIPHGHEVASHGYSHEDEAAFDKLDYRDQVSQLKKSKELLEDIAGREVISFRAPALRINEYTPRALESAGFKIDSSIASQRADFIFSFGGYKKINRLRAPRLPYFASKTDLTKKGDSTILEVPISSPFCHHTRIEEYFV